MKKIYIEYVEENKIICDVVYGKSIKAIKELYSVTHKVIKCCLWEQMNRY